MDSPVQDMFWLKSYSARLLCAHQGAAAWLHQATGVSWSFLGHTGESMPDALFPVVAGEHNACGGVISGLSGSFSSPQYPENYPTDIQCVWEIHVDKTFRIELMIPSLK